MKLSKCFTALLVPIIFSGASSANEVHTLCNKDNQKLDFFGQFTGVHYFSENKDKNINNAFVIYNFHNETKINENIIGFGTLEHKIALYDDAKNSVGLKSEKIYTSLCYAGIQLKNFGSISFGRNYGILYDANKYTDIRPEFCGKDVFIEENFLSYRASNLLTYRNSNFFGLMKGLNFAIQLQGKNESRKDKDRSVLEENGKGYGVSISYNITNNISAAAAYSKSDRTEGQKSVSSSNRPEARAYVFGLKFDSNNIYLAASHSATSNMTPYGNFSDDKKPSPNNTYGFADKAKNTILVAQYKFNCGFTPSIGFVRSKIKNFNALGLPGYRGFLIKSIGTNLKYDFNKNISSFIDYRFNFIKKSSVTESMGIFSKNLLLIGMTYTF